MRFPRRRPGSEGEPLLKPQPRARTSRFRWGSQSQEESGAEEQAVPASQASYARTHTGTWGASTTFHFNTTDWQRANVRVALWDNTGSIPIRLQEPEDDPTPPIERTPEEMLAMAEEVFESPTEPGALPSGEVFLACSNCGESEAWTFSVPVSGYRNYSLSVVGIGPEAASQFFNQTMPLSELAPGHQLLVDSSYDDFEVEDDTSECTLVCRECGYEHVLSHPNVDWI